MDKNELNELIRKVDEKIQQYATSFSNNTMQADLNMNVGLLNERTLAFFATYKLNETLNQSYTVNLCVNELSVKMPQLSSSTTNALNAEVGGRSRQRSWKRNAYIDSYLDLDNLFFNGKNHLFIEYKLSNKFDFTQLAQDFLKYKIYLHNPNSNNSIFTYIIFNKNDNYPSILSSKTDKFVKLKKDITNTSFDDDDKVFIYIDEGINLNFESEEIKELYKALNEINKLSSEIKNVDSVVSDYNEFRNNLFLQNIGAFKNNVSIANDLVRNANEFKKMFNQVKEDGRFIRYFTEFKINDESEPVDLEFNYTLEDQKRIIEFIKNYFLAFEKHYGSEDKQEASLKGLNVSFKSSLNIIVILKIFAIINRLDFEPSLTIVNKDKPNEINHNIISDNLANEKVEIYNRAGEKDDFNKLALGILYFINNLYSLIVDIDEESGNSSLNELYRNNKKVKSIQNAINIIKKELELEEDLEILKPDFREKSISIVNEIINR